MIFLHVTWKRVFFVDIWRWLRGSEQRPTSSSPTLSAMTTVLRRPLAARQPEQPAWSQKLASPLAQALRVQPTATTSTNNKRPRSPGADDTNNAKRVKGPLALAVEQIAKATAANTSTSQHATNAKETKENKEKLRQKEEREQARKEFVAKYTKAFPSFVFYFDERDGGRQQAETRVTALGAVGCPFSIWSLRWG